MVVLSYYDNETVRIVSENPLALTLVFYDKSGHPLLEGVRHA